MSDTRLTVTLERRRSKTYEVTNAMRHLVVFQDHGDIRLTEIEGGEVWAASPFRVVRANTLLCLPMTPEEAEDVARALNDAVRAAKAFRRDRARREHEGDTKPTRYHFGKDDPRCGRPVTLEDSGNGMLYCSVHGNLNYSGEVVDASAP